MVSSAAPTVEAYLAELPEDRRDAIAQVRQVILQSLPEGYEECMQYGMLSYVVPLERYPKTYNKQPLAFVSLASQKNYMSLYLNCVYSDPELERAFVEAYANSGKTLDMGKSCVRFKRAEDLPLDVVADAVAGVPIDAFIAQYEAARAAAKKR